MQNRITQKFKSLSRQKQKAFIAFITAGDPNLETTEELVLAFEKCGVDIVELGVPFSDPLADGPTIQASSQRSLSKHTSLQDILKLAARIRKKSNIPLCLMTYYNPVFHFGEKKFVEAAKRSGVDGIIIPDLPPEEGTFLLHEAKQSGLSTICFIAPTTTEKRVKHIIPHSTGFIYYLSLTGVTGAGSLKSNALMAPLKKIKKLTKTPLCVGFGISTPQDVKNVAKGADGVIVGSAIVKEIARYSKDKECVAKVSQFVSKLVKGLTHV